MAVLSKFVFAGVSAAVIAHTASARYIPIGPEFTDGPVGPIGPIPVPTQVTGAQATTSNVSVSSVVPASTSTRVEFGPGPGVFPPFRFNKTRVTLADKAGLHNLLVYGLDADQVAEGAVFVAVPQNLKLELNKAAVAGSVSAKNLPTTFSTMTKPHNNGTTVSVIASQVVKTSNAPTLATAATPTNAGSIATPAETKLTAPTATSSATATAERSESTEHVEHEGSDEHEEQEEHVDEAQKRDTEMEGNHPYYTPNPCDYATDTEECDFIYWPLTFSIHLPTDGEHDKRDVEAQVANLADDALNVVLEHDIDGDGKVQLTSSIPWTPDMTEEEKKAVRVWFVEQGQANLEPKGGDRMEGVQLPPRNLKDLKDSYFTPTFKGNPVEGSHCYMGDVNLCDKAFGSDAERGEPDSKMVNKRGKKPESSLELHISSLKDARCYIEKTNVCEILARYGNKKAWDCELKMPHKKGEKKSVTCQIKGEKGKHDKGQTLNIPLN